MSSPDRTQLEEAIRASCLRGDLRDAAEIAIRGYGPEILGFLVAMSPSEEDGAEAFATFSEDLWRGLPGFSFSCTFRTWAYTLARHAGIRVGVARRRDARHVALSDCPEVAEIADAVRTATLTMLRTETKSKLAELRDGLPDEDKAVLILRVDRKLSWTELAQVLLAPGEAIDADVLKREAARLRKRFQLIKQRLLVELGRTPAPSSDRGTSA